MKLCKDCKHISRFWLVPWALGLAKCNSPQRKYGTNPVSGKRMYTSPAFCETSRSFTNYDCCGPFARFFEDKV
jgi:hypothetical protein